MVGVLGWREYNASLHHRAELQASALCSQYLTDSIRLPNPSAYANLRAISLKGTQAQIAPLQIAQEGATPNTAHALRVSWAKVKISHLALTGTAPAVLQATVTIQRHFHPSGQNVETATATFWLVNQNGLKVEAATFNTSQNLNSDGPDSFDLNLWNTVPAGPLPHGN